MTMTITIGSLFSGIGGFELGLERGIPESKTIWQVEENPFCKSILKKHWPNSQLFDDVRQVGVNLPPVDLICGGFPCTDISIAGKRGGIYEGRKSSLWWEMRRIIGILVPKVAIIENVPGLTFRDGGGWNVLSSLAKIGFDAEWINISARDFGAPHKRERIFIVAYPHHHRQHDLSLNAKTFKSQKIDQSHTVGETYPFSGRSRKNGWMEPQNYWAGFPNSPRFCRRDDGIPNRVARLKALGNAIVPQCSEWIGRQVFNSGLLS